MKGGTREDTWHANCEHEMFMILSGAPCSLQFFFFVCVCLFSVISWYFVIRVQDETRWTNQAQWLYLSSVFGLALFCVIGNGCAKGVYCCLGNVVLLGDGVVWCFFFFAGSWYLHVLCWWTQPQIQTFSQTLQTGFVQVSWITLGPTTDSGSGTVVGKCFQGSVRLVIKHIWTLMSFADLKT